MSEEVKKKESTALSHSTAKNLLACEHKFMHYKVLKTPQDSDYKKSNALAIGSAVHWILEKSHGDTPEDILADIEECITKPDVRLYPDDRYLVQACALKIIRLNKKLGLRVAGVEPSIDLSWFTGRIDVIEEDSDMKWWITDYKCMGQFDPVKNAPFLYQDPQLNIYAARSKEIAKLLGLNVEDFGGCRYRVVVKPRLKMRAKESAVEYTMRLLESAKAYDVKIPIESMEPGEAEDRHKKLYRRSMVLRKSPEKAERNYNSCFSYGKACEYFSQCHGKNFSEMGFEVTEGP